MARLGTITDLFTSINKNVSTGAAAEKATEKYLKAQGLKSVTKNYRSRLGEIDLIMQDGETLVFIEVRMRNHKNYGSGADSVTVSKQKKIIRTAQAYLQKSTQDYSCRFDVVSVSTKDSEHQFQWIKNAFYAE
ncbi:MAG: YraN family protein [Cellvibrionaceae bacterium]